MKKWQLKMSRSETLAMHAPKRKQSALAHNLDQTSVTDVRGWTKSVYMGIPSESQVLKHVRKYASYAL
jgi:hypothetical protein